MIERRSSRFTERLSMTVVVVAAIGGYLVLLDPTVSGLVFGFEWKVGTGDFSAELKGAVVTIMLIGGWTAVVSFWIGASKGEEQKSAALSRIAESTPVPVSQPPSSPIAAEHVQVTGDNVEVTEKLDEARLCPNCNAPQEPGVSFCNKCGVPQPKEGG